MDGLARGIIFNDSSDADVVAGVQHTFLPYFLGQNLVIHFGFFNLCQIMECSTSLSLRFEDEGRRPPNPETRNHCGLCHCRLIIGSCTFVELGKGQHCVYRPSLGYYIS